MNEIWAVVQSCKVKEGTVHNQQQQMEETHLCSKWELSMKCGPASWQGERRVNIVPELYVVSTEDIYESLLVFKERPHPCESWDGKGYIWLVKH
jgi:hypothetical protein